MSFENRLRQQLSYKTFDSTSIVNSPVSSPNVISANFSIPAAYSCIRINYIEIASGITLEVGAGAFLDIT